MELYPSCIFFLYLLDCHFWIQTYSKSHELEDFSTDIMDTCISSKIYVTKSQFIIAHQNEVWIHSNVSSLCLKYTTEKQ